jgi:hypothetical protein
MWQLTASHAVGVIGEELLVHLVSELKWEISEAVNCVRANSVIDVSIGDA